MLLAASTMSLASTMSEINEVTRNVAIYIMLFTYYNYTCATILTVTLMLFSNAQGKSVIVSTCRICYYFHHCSPCRFTKSLHIVASLQPAGKHCWQTCSGVPSIVILNCFQTSKANSKTYTNGLPTTGNWRHLFQQVKKIIVSYQGEIMFGKTKLCIFYVQWSPSNTDILG